MAMNTKQAAEKWGISDRRVRKLCIDGAINGAFKIGKNWFIPESANKPSDSRMKKEDSLLDLIFEKKLLLDSKRPFSEGELNQLYEEFMIEYTYNSNAIEGNILTLRETDMVLRGLTIDQKPLKDHLEVIGHKEAFYYVLDLVKEKKEINEFIIKQIHSLVLNDKPMDRGVYRKIPVRIIGAFNDPVQPYLIESKMNELLIEYKNNNENIAKKLALFHILFEGIHPFIDGNGRTSRLLMNFEAIKKGYPPIVIKNDIRPQYYESLDKAHTTGDYTDFIKLVAKAEEESLDLYLKVIG